MANQTSIWKGIINHRSPKLLICIWCLYTWLRTNAVYYYYKTLYGNLLYPWIFFRNKTCKTILFHLLVQCLLLLLHVESWAVSSIIERVIGSGRWGEVEETEVRKPSWFTGKTHHTLSAIKSSHALRSVQELASNRPDASSDRQTDQKTIHSPNTGEKATTFQFLLCHIPELTSHDTIVSTNGHASWFPGHVAVRDWSKWHCDK